MVSLYSVYLTDTQIWEGTGTAVSKNAHSHFHMLLRKRLLLSILLKSLSKNYIYLKVIKDALENLSYQTDMNQHKQKDKMDEIQPHDLLNV